MEMSVYSHKANDRFRRDKISILEQLGICISKEKEAEIPLTVAYYTFCVILQVVALIGFLTDVKDSFDCNNR